MEPQPPALDPKEVQRKLDRFFELVELSRELAMAGIRHQHPDASPEEVRRLFAERLAFGRKGKWGIS